MLAFCWWSVFSQNVQRPRLRNRGKLTQLRREKKSVNDSCFARQCCAWQSVRWCCRHRRQRCSVQASNARSTQAKRLRCRRALALAQRGIAVKLACGYNSFTPVRPAAEACEHSRLTLRSRGQSTAAHVFALCRRRWRRCLPLTLNVRLHK